MRPNSLALIFKNNNSEILLGKGKDTTRNLSFYRPLGGGIEFGETSLVTLKREIKEEIGGSLKNEKLLTVYENIFEYNSTKMHEINFIYKAELNEDHLLNAKLIPILDKKDRYAEWMSVADIKSGKIKVFPEECLKFI